MHVGIVLWDNGSRLAQIVHTDHSDVYAMFPHVVPKDLALRVFPHVPPIEIALVHLK